MSSFILVQRGSHEIEAASGLWYSLPEPTLARVRTVLVRWAAKVLNFLLNTLYQKTCPEPPDVESLACQRCPRAALVCTATRSFCSSLKELCSVYREPSRCLTVSSQRLQSACSCGLSWWAACGGPRQPRRCQTDRLGNSSLMGLHGCLLAGVGGEARGNV